MKTETIEDRNGSSSIRGINSIEKMSKEIVNNVNVQKKWRDYVHFRLNFFENELKWILNPQMFKHLQFTRNQIGTFTASNHEIVGNFDQFHTLMNNQLLKQSSNSNSNSNLEIQNYNNNNNNNNEDYQISLKYFIIWNCMLDMFYQFNTSNDNIANLIKNSNFIQLLKDLSYQAHYPKFHAKIRWDDMLVVPRFAMDTR